MPTNAQLKALTQSQIANKTEPGSIQRGNVAARIEAGYDYTDQQVGAKEVAFSLTVPFDHPNSYMNHNVNGPMHFIPGTSGAIKGGFCTMRLVADGISGHVPSFDTAILKSGGSENYSNVSGQIHRIYFDYDGTDFVYVIQKIGTSAVESTPLTFTHRTDLTNSGTTFSKSGGGTFGGRGLDNLTLPASTDGRVFLKVADLTKTSMIGFSTTNAVQAYGGFLAAAWADANTIASVENGSLYTSIGATTVLNDYVGVQRRSGVFYIQKSSDGVNWIDVRNTGITNTSTMYVVMTTNDDMYDPQGENLV